MYEALQVSHGGHLSSTKVRGLLLRALGTGASGLIPHSDKLKGLTRKQKRGMGPEVE